ncbi:hypothetical protein CABS03_00703 [Colletotrichum abscissum]|uniref:Uncharacterized protein n=1 Tax=Colletotrichum abscissum TaxID=1671311 RepID=A0A9P9XML9_9PEZI|nr:hypothetical protein CABS02_03574 [Colletotrichum abscissum]
MSQSELMEHQRQHNHTTPHRAMSSSVTGRHGRPVRMHGALVYVHNGSNRFQGFVRVVRVEPSLHSFGGAFNV